MGTWELQRLREWVYAECGFRATDEELEHWNGPLAAVKRPEWTSAPPPVAVTMENMMNADDDVTQRNAEHVHTREVIAVLGNELKHVTATLGELKTAVLAVPGDIEKCIAALKATYCRDHAEKLAAVVKQTEANRELLDEARLGNRRTATWTAGGATGGAALVIAIVEAIKALAGQPSHAGLHAAAHNGPQESPSAVVKPN